MQLPGGRTPPIQLRRVPGDRFALATVESAERDEVWVRALGEAGPLGAGLRLEGARLASALPLGDDVALVLSRGAELCVQTGLLGDTPRESCAVSGAQAAYASGGKPGEAGAVFFVDVESPPQKLVTAPKRPSPKIAPKRPPRKPSTKKPKGVKLPGKPPATKPKAAVKVKPRPAPPREPVKLLARKWTAAGGFDEQRPTGLSFVRPQAGMDVVGALGAGSSGWVAFYETGKKPKGPMGSARISLAQLDAAGTLVGKHQPLAEGELEWGGVKGLHAPRLVTVAGSDPVALATLGSPASASRDLLPKGSCALASLAKVGAPSELACALGVFGVAEAELAAFGPLAKAARRVPGQAASDPPYGAFAGHRLYFLSDGRVRSAKGSESRDELPFPETEVELTGGSIASDGEALVVIDQKLARVSATGEVSIVGPVPSGTASSFVRIGATWATSRGAPQRAREVRPSSDEDTSVLLGGETFGWRLALARTAADATELELSRVDGELVSAPAFTIAPSPVASGFAAAPDGRGGVLVVGPSPSDPRRLVSARLDPTSRAVAAVELGPRLEGVGRVELASAGSSGSPAAAIAWLPDSGEVLWLDSSGRELAAARAPRAGLPCAGFAAARVPSAVPGVFEALPGGGEGACAVGLGAFGPRAAFVVERAGLSLTASFVRLPGAPPAGGVPRPWPAESFGSAGGPPSEAATAGASKERLCPAEMVLVPPKDELAAFCVDRFESVLAQASGDGAGNRLSPDFSPTAGLLEAAVLVWSTARERTGDLHAQALPPPLLPSWQRQAKVSPFALVRRGERPNGYVTGIAAEQACAAAGKRLCTHDEFVTACRGEKDTLFPYGDDFVDGACNVFRDRHPAALLHGNASLGHLDPRLNRVPGLFAKTGSYPRCRSAWGDDAIYDLVGNLDEWVDVEGGAFAGGFYARSTRNGCESLIDAHPRGYADYSTGVRCCRARR